MGAKESEKKEPEELQKDRRVLGELEPEDNGGRATVEESSDAMYIFTKMQRWSQDHMEIATIQLWMLARKTLV